MLIVLAAPAHAEPDLVNVLDIDPSIQVDLKYATPDNFMGEVLYEDARCFLRDRKSVV
jgi:D-alanyl-D-alanine dipeptidase